MKQKSTIIFRIYAVVVVCELLLIYLQQSHQRWFTKPLLMPLLLLGFYFASSNRNNNLFRFICSALLFSWAGDVLLQISGLFIPGLISFLLAHIFYIVYFMRCMPGKKGFVQVQPLIVIPVLLYIILFLWLLFPYLGAMKIPVTGYGITIGTMLLMSINMHRKIKNTAASFFIVGALLFVISDSLLAVNIFASQSMLLGLAVMFTYAAAQYFIIRGALANSTT